MFVKVQSSYFSQCFSISSSLSHLSLLSPLFQVVISGRSQWKRETKVCTSVNLTKACKNPEELGNLPFL